jgi:hypothetical protein
VAAGTKTDRNGKRDLFRPGGVLDDLHEVRAAETGAEVLKHIGVDIAERGLRAVLVTLCESGQDLPLEVRPRVGGGDGVDAVRSRS